MQTKRNIKPGKLSDRLKEALGMGPLSPPPWLLNMQRYGPPPAYPRLRLPGLNAPIPAGCTYGYQPGGWGRPPVDESGSLLFKLEEEVEEEAAAEDLAAAEGLWGELPPDAEAPPEEEEPETEGPAEGQQPTAETPFGGGASSVGLTSMGLESPAALELQQQQQQRGGVSSVASSGPKAYTVLTPEETQVQQGQLFGVRHTYRIPAGALAGQQQQQQQQQQLLQQGGASGVQTPAGIATPRLLSGRASPFVAGLRSPFAPAAAAAAAAAASGANTPLMAQRGGAATPAGVTVSLNPNEMEQEGAFTADVIRQQLRQHEEAAARAKAAAGQIDPADQRKRKGDELRGVSAAAAKSKRKKQFKF
ncbi:splicing factor 3B subunit 2, putative [Eimeria necatrix]|uniref:Splicing factor 3B subunit 2, putative n=1 Tax=Eimeria necatrix TaxID=51315 RepID=U6N3Z2_9EIME|nr:splicing factor 3B subunit 2, putative [Eimeria necatrix]CDJ68640.1 splicing factor 3B subunit 2, putative [Eimeria necatrix]